MSWKDNPDYLREQIDKAKDEAWHENQAAAKMNDEWIDRLAKADQKIMELEDALSCLRKGYVESMNKAADRIEKVESKNKAIRELCEKYKMGKYNFCASLVKDIEDILGSEVK